MVDNQPITELINDKMDKISITKIAHRLKETRIRMTSLLAPAR